MNLPQVHERFFIAQEAESIFAIRVNKEVFDGYEPEISEIINMLSQSILNLEKEENEKNIINEYHKKIEDILKDVSTKYNLTYGEMVGILTAKIQSFIKYQIRLERHNDINKEGSLK
ncbi:MAG: hypothetical protein K0R54_168 [Clostridiaceae bacterium]|jgi:hypothetical protein|nr:hypothetical protein [Clostridiaceae bacterium]